MSSENGRQRPAAGGIGALLELRTMWEAGIIIHRIEATYLFTALNTTETK